MNGWKLVRRTVRQRTWWAWAFEILIMVVFFITFFTALIVLEAVHRGG